MMSGNSCGVCCRAARSTRAVRSAPPAEEASSCRKVPTSGISPDTQAVRLAGEGQKQPASRTAEAATVHRRPGFRPQYKAQAAAKQCLQAVALMQCPCCTASNRLSQLLQAGVQAHVFQQVHRSAPNALMGLSSQPLVRQGTDTRYACSTCLVREVCAGLAERFMLGSTHLRGYPEDEVDHSGEHCCQAQQHHALASGRPAHRKQIWPHSGRCVIAASLWSAAIVSAHCLPKLAHMAPAHICISHASPMAVFPEAAKHGQAACTDRSGGKHTSACPAARCSRCGAGRWLCVWRLPQSTRRPATGWGLRSCPS